MSASNISLIKQALRDKNIVNETLINGIVATIGKESKFIPQSENLNYSAKRIMEVWPYITPAEAAKLANNPKALAARVYGGKYGNITPADSFAYRGRGFNQITFKNQYYNLTNKLGIDLINNPDLLNKPEIAAKAAAQFYADAFKNGAKIIKTRYNVDIRNITPGTNPLTLLKIAVNANSGWRKDPNIVESEYLKALPYFNDLQTMAGKPVTSKHNLIIPIILLTLLMLAIKK